MAGNYVSLNFVNGNPSGGSISVSGSGDGTTITTAKLIVNSDSVQVGKNLCYITPNVGFIFSHVVAEGDIGSITLTPGQSQMLDSVSDFDPIIVTIYFESNKYTTNYQLKKPATTDYVTIGDINDNMDKIDTQMKVNADTIAGKAGTSVATQSANGLMSSADKTKLDGVDSALAGKVSKSGDTMTGNLVRKSTQYENNDFAQTRHVLGEYDFDDKNGVFSGYLRRVGTTATQFTQIGCVANINGATVSSSVEAHILPDGATYATAPSWSVGTNDNSDKIMTIKMANSLPSLVHTTGNETLAGNKIFTGTFGLQRTNPQIIIKDTDGDSTIQPSSNQTPFYLQVQDKNGKVYCNLLGVAHRASDDAFVCSFGNSARTWSGGIKIITLPNGTEYAECPTPPSGATKKEIVTADWSLSKFQRKITYGTGDPSGGEDGDIYIQI